MRDDEIRRVLTEANPWWSTSDRTKPAAWTGFNRTLQGRATFDLGYRSKVLDDIAETEPDGSLIVLTGPRRCGKTVAILDAAARLCAHPAIDPRQIIYVPCDGMLQRDLRRLFTLGRAVTGSVDRPSGRKRVWLLDEVSAISGWTSVVKAARDNTSFGDDTVVATGSRWASNEDVQGNLLAGRAGSGTGHRIRQLLPMSFRDYLSVTHPDLALPPIVHPSLLDGPEARQALVELWLRVDRYDLAWQDYLSCGGFPRAVAEYHRDGRVSEAYFRDLLAWLRADVDPDAATESVPLLLAGITERMTSPLSVADTAGKLGYPNRDSFERRITRLINSHATLRCRQRKDNGTLVARAQYKLYLTDPILAWLPSKISAGLPEPDFTVLSEMVLAIALARVIDAHDEGRWVADDTIGYARTSSGNEVDFGPVRVPTSSGSAVTVPIESKWTDTHWRSEAKTIEGKYGRGVLATKSLLDLDHPSQAVPAPMLACLIG